MTPPREGWRHDYGDAMERCPACGGKGFIPDVKVCANETCGREFRWTDDKPRHGGRTVGLMYCSDRCAKAQAQRQYRRRRRTA